MGRNSCGFWFKKLIHGKMKEITIILGDISEKGKEKLKKHSEKLNKRLDEMKKEFESGKFNDIIKDL